MAKHDRPRSEDDDAALERILRFQVEHHEQGKLIELDRKDGLVIQIRNGRVLATTVDQAGHETLCVLRGAGALLGLEALDGMVLPYFLWTLSDVELGIAPAGPARAWLAADDHPAHALLRRSLRAVRVCLSERMALHGSATARLARLLLDAAGEGDSDSHAQIVLGLPKNVLARMLQMRPETLSRVLRKLEDDGAIVLEPDLAVADRKRLAEHVSERGD
jgi:CRP/FNR family transcriptional regulator, cyclic AMP receptor protein